MSTAFVTLFPGGTAERFDALIAEMGTGHSEQPDRIIFAAGPVPEGWEIIQVWRHREPADKLAAEHLVPAMGRIGSRGFQAPPQTFDFEVHDLRL